MKYGNCMFEVMNYALLAKRRSLTFPSVLFVCILSRPGGTAGPDSRSTSLKFVGKG